jgi:hypothetical protein
LPSLFSSPQRQIALHPDAELSRGDIPADIPVAAGVAHHLFDLAVAGALNDVLLHELMLAIATLQVHCLILSS